MKDLLLYSNTSRNKEQKVKQNKKKTIQPDNLSAKRTAKSHFDSCASVNQCQSHHVSTGTIKQVIHTSD